MTEEDPELYSGYTAAQLHTLMQSGHWPSVHFHAAIKWLGDHERRELARISASSLEQGRTALAAKNAAITAARAAIATIVLAIVAIIVSVLAWLYPREPPPSASPAHAASAASSTQS